MGRRRTGRNGSSTSRRCRRGSTSCVRTCSNEMRNAAAVKTEIILRAIRPTGGRIGASWRAGSGTRRATGGARTRRATGGTRTRRAGSVARTGRATGGGAPYGPYAGLVNLHRRWRTRGRRRSGSKSGLGLTGLGVTRLARSGLGGARLPGTPVGALHELDVLTIWHAEEGIMRIFERLPQDGP